MPLQRRCGSRNAGGKTHREMERQGVAHLKVETGGVRMVRFPVPCCPAQGAGSVCLGYGTCERIDWPAGSPILRIEVDKEQERDTEMQVFGLPRQFTCATRLASRLSGEPSIGEGRRRDALGASMSPVKWFSAHSVVSCAGLQVLSTGLPRFHPRAVPAGAGCSGRTIRIAAFQGPERRSGGPFPAIPQECVEHVRDGATPRSLLTSSIIIVPCPDIGSGVEASDYIPGSGLSQEVALMQSVAAGQGNGAGREEAGHQR